ncbi:MAG: hypothetical protein JW700_02755 [Candidatus Aenigmarchaeota archaeon]|nr:hypothetical protein [Candidatus Aenigmarchaeota archaeon]
MKEWGVTDAGYSLLQKTGLEDRLENNWQKIEEQIPYGAILDDWYVDDTVNDESILEDRKEKIKQWLKKTQEYDRKPQDLFLLSGKVTDMILTDEEKSDAKRFGVENITQLDQLLGAYSLSKRDNESNISRQKYTWQSKGFRTQVFGDMHGDLCLRQVNTKPENEKHFSGKLKTNFIGAYYDYWPILVATSLKYADTVNVDIPNANNWKNFMKSYGWEGKIRTAGNCGVGYNSFVWDFNDCVLAELPAKTNVREIQKRFFGLMQPDSSRDVYHLPLIDEKKDLVFCSSYGEGTPINLAPLGTSDEYFKKIVVPKDDASHLFSGSVHGIMTNQSRTNPDILAFMLWQHDQIKAGKTENEIMKEAHEFESF